MRALGRVCAGVYALTEFSKSKKPWDARGDVYVRFGEPDHRSRSDDPNFKQSLKVQRVKERLAIDIYKGDVRAHTFVGPVYPVRSLKQLDGAWYELKDIDSRECIRIVRIGAMKMMSLPMILELVPQLARAPQEGAYICS